MRLFTAIDLPATVLLRMERLLVALRSEAQIKWSPLDNLHITTKFIGEWPEERLAELTAALSCLSRSGGFSLELKGVGWFPTERSPRVLFLGVESSKGLSELAANTNRCLEKLGIALDKRDFTPHLTLAKVRQPVPLNRLKQRLGEFGEITLGSFPVSSFGLFRSDPGSNGSRYRKLHAFDLEAALAAS